MDYTPEKNNKTYLSGEIVSPAVYSHEVFGEGFYEFNVSVNRLSGQADILPVTVSERLVKEGISEDDVCSLEVGLDDNMRPAITDIYREETEV